ncbi:MAG: hypothetical protein KJ989_12910 [Gammaproteobacteria bacterium]|uniref:Uncharacterized protein n=1 Tax=viral metagenome TaxID=1070528 RepID=A0A6H1ZX23_9ZZZZ|nr:hypothetical protein [Gammaproteobacteria bacterium]MBU2157115.1 hypothetical protein [Gammaproteobacteria bacterium]MBU2256029.1 hypothetical protein [Gammaproteobacteria bacterium]MBU2295097.1 hypothetical protein [Gammaproteobacteria bacterium]
MRHVGLRSDAKDIASQEQLFVRDSTTLAASGTSVDFNGLPSSPHEFTLTFHGVSLSGASQIVVLLGTSSSFENTGYNCHSSRTGGSSAATQAYTIGIVFANTGASDVFGGVLKITRQSGNTYAFEGSLGCTGYIVDTSGSKALSGVLTRIRVTAFNGTDSYDGGTLGLAREGLL